MVEECVGDSVETAGNCGAIVEVRSSEICGGNVEVGDSGDCGTIVEIGAPDKSGKEVEVTGCCGEYVEMGGANVDVATPAGIKNTKRYKLVLLCKIRGLLESIKDKNIVL